MNASDAARQLEDLARDIDLMVYRLEVAPSGVATGEPDLARLRRELELVREQLQDLARALD